MKNENADDLKICHVVITPIMVCRLFREKTVGR